MKRMPNKQVDVKKSLGDLFRYLKPYSGLILLAVLLAAFGTFFSITGPKILSRITNHIQDVLVSGSVEFDFKYINKIGFILIGIYIFSAIAQYIQARIMTHVTQTVCNRLRRDISHKINRLPLNYFDTRTHGDVLSVATNDIDTLGQSLNQAISQLVSSMTMLIGISIMLISISWIMFVIALVSVPVSMVLMFFVVGKSQRYFKQQQESLGELNGHIEEVYSGHNVIKVFNAEDEVSIKFNSINKKLYNSSYKSQFLSGMMMPIMTFVSNAAYIVICIIGGNMAANKTLKVGDIVASIQYIRQFNQPLGQIAQILNVLQQTAAASDRVFTFLNETEMTFEKDKITKMEKVVGNVEFDHVKFGYSEDKIIINDFSIKVKAGQKVAIVGPTGAGKTTIVNLLMRFYELNSGDIIIDGIKTTDMTRECVHSLFSMVLQDTWLFEGTIKENIKYGKLDATDEEVYEACKMAHIDYFIRSLPGGYDMVLDDNANLSQGQKQLFTIARAMLANRQMLILDEATSSVDTRTEILIQKAMDKLTEGRTSFVIAHRLSTIKNADLILVMKDGNIIETGNHEQLITLNGFYADLYNSQFSEN